MEAALVTCAVLAVLFGFRWQGAALAMLARAARQHREARRYGALRERVLEVERRYSALARAHRDLGCEVPDHIAVELGEAVRLLQEIDACDDTPTPPT